MAKNNKIVLAVLIAAAALSFALIVYIKHYAPLDVDEGTLLRVWYVDDCASWERIDGLVESFNEGEGAKLGISVQTNALADADELRQALSRIKERGLSMPNVLLCDSDLAASLYGEGLLAEVSTYFESWEETFFDKDAVKASSLDGTLIAVPVAASVNVAAANKESLDSGELDCESFEELCDKAREYYANTGSRLFSITDYADFFRTAMAQLGESFHAESPHSTDSEKCKYIYSLIAETAYDRGIGPASDEPVQLIAQGELPLTFMPSDMFVQQCSNEQAESVSLLRAYPVMSGGDDVYSQKVYAVTIFASDENSENASAMFIRWFTSADVNTELCANSGLIPSRGDMKVDETSEAGLVFYEYYNKLERGSDCDEREADPLFAESSKEFNGILHSVIDSMD